jgi:hypothetical protein
MLAAFWQVCYTVSSTDARAVQRDISDGLSESDGIKSFVSLDCSMEFFSTFNNQNRG